VNTNITAMILTFNEERRLPYIYENLKGFCKIIVFDGGSTDGTLDYCKANNIKVVPRPKEGSVEKRVEGLFWAISKVQTEYVLHVICSHFYPKELLNCFSDIANDNKLSAVYHDVVIYRYGVVVHKPLLRRVSSACNFYKRNVVNFEKSKIHDEMAIQFDENSMVRLDGTDELSLHLFQDEDCQSYAIKTLGYATTEANQRFNAGQRIGFCGLIFKPLTHFLYGYFRTGAFVRGKEGLVYSILNLIYEFHIAIILWELCHNLKLKGAITKNGLVREKLIKESNKS